MPETTSTSASPMRRASVSEALVEPVGDVGEADRQLVFGRDHGGTYWPDVSRLIP
jgi:hypothetical protein